VLAAGPLAGAIGTITAAAGATALGAGIGAAAGGLLGGLMGAGVPEEDARAYVEGVRRGGTLLTVNASDVEADDVREIMVRNGAIDMGRRADEWRAGGWGDPAINSDAALREQSVEAGLGRESLADVDRQVVDPAYTNVDRTGERVKDSGYASGHQQPREHEPQAFSEYVADDERNFRTPVDTRSDTPASTSYRAESYNTLEGDAGRRNDLASEGGLRSERYAGADEMGGAMSNMGAGDGSDQPGRAADQPGAVRIYNRDDPARDTGDELPAHGDFARGQRSDEAPAVEPDYARGMHGDTVSERDRVAHGEQLPGMPHHGDFARGQREEGAAAREPDYARGQRAFETYDSDFMAHYGSMTGAGGQPYDYYRPGYKFGYDMAHDRGYDHESWDHAEHEARQSWERDARGSWEEFKDTIRYGWEKARGLR
jgi:hypothetical protein